MSNSIPSIIPSLLSNLIPNPNLIPNLLRNLIPSLLRNLIPNLLLTANDAILVERRLMMKRSDAVFDRVNKGWREDLTTSFE